jgi:hypothetical protein
MAGYKGTREIREEWGRVDTANWIILQRGDERLLFELISEKVSVRRLI